MIQTFGNETVNDTDIDNDYYTDEMLGMGESVEAELEFMGYDEYSDNGYEIPSELMGGRFLDWIKKKRKRFKARKKARLLRLKKKWKSLPKWKKVLLAPVIGPAILATGLVLAPRLAKHAARAGIARAIIKRRKRNNANMALQSISTPQNIQAIPQQEYQYDTSIERVEPQQQQQQPQSQYVAPLPPVSIDRIPETVEEKSKMDIKKMLPIIGVGVVGLGAVAFMSKKKR